MPNKTQAEPITSDLNEKELENEKNKIEIINGLLNGLDNVIDKLNKLDYAKNYGNRFIIMELYY